VEANDILTKVVRRAHSRWNQAGRTGPGRIDLADTDLSGLRCEGARFQGIRLVRCDLRRARLSAANFGDAELIDCNFDDSDLGAATFDGARIEGCTFRGSPMQIAYIKGAQVRGCDFAGAALSRAHFEDSTVADSGFARADLSDAVFDRGRFERCRFREAQIPRVKDNLPLGHAFEAVFEKCDFREVKAPRWRLSRTRFVDCAFAGMTGPVALEGAVTLERPDLSDGADGSRPASPEEVLRQLGA
jgi:uncharacterized protein YjbI with pentapeptide repeats